MSIRDIVRQVKPVLEKNSIDYTYFVQDLLSEQAEFPSEVFDGFSFEKDSKRSSSRRTVFIVRSNDRDNDRDEIGRRLKQQGIIYNVVPSSYSSFDPIEATHDGNNNNASFVQEKDITITAVVKDSGGSTVVASSTMHTAKVTHQPTA